jgi:ornithine cyclodeaminase/alanine dehydrogenase-like protein (mu-crystallin family)
VTLRFIDGEELSRVLPMDAAVDALQTALAKGEVATAPQRGSLEVEGGEVLLMPAAGSEGIGVKLVTVAPGNPARGLPLVQAVYALFEPETLGPEALLDGAALTAVRTAAVSGLATRLLAREDATTLALFGAGVQAHAHLDAMRAVQPIEEVVVISRGRQRAERLVERATEIGVHARVAGPEAVAAADVVCTCTTSAQPVFDGALLRPGAHVNAIGAYRPDQREVDDETVRRARVVVETRQAVLAEAGDVVIPLRSGVIGPDHIVAELAEVAAGTPVRRGPGDITLFKSVGVAFEDLIVARAAVDRLRGRADD